MVQKERIICKCYTSEFTIQPFVIVVGVSEDDIKELFLYFYKNLVKCKSFLYALELCFKSFQILSLEYPKASYDPWFFIQKYFFEKDSSFDKKSSKKTALRDYLSK